MAATNKEELLALCQKEFDKLEQLLDPIDTDTALVKDSDDTSIKDIIGHRMHWIHLFLGWYQDGLAGRIVFFPAKGYKWNELKRYNADLRTSQTTMGWQDVRSGLRQAYDDLVEFITRTSDVDLYGGPMVGANNEWTPGRWAEAAGPSHFRSATKYTRARLRKDSSAPA